MASFWETLKKGNTSSASAAIGNIVLAVIKGVAAFTSGSGAMFAEAMHSGADAVNQVFVFVGSILAERKPTRRFPTGFGRLINVFCMVAVIVVTIMAYETILEGWHLIKNPVETSGFLFNMLILSISIAIDGSVLIKAMKEIVHEARVEARGLAIVATAFANLRLAAPPTRLVFFEDLVATSGSALAMIAIIIGRFTTYKVFDGIAAILIGAMMIGVVFRVGYDNMVGLIGVAAPMEVEEKVSGIILADQDVTDINRMRILQEGRFYHVEAIIELRPGFSLAAADDIKVRVRDKLLSSHDITDVTLGIIEDNGVVNWLPEGVVT